MCGLDVLNAVVEISVHVDALDRERGSETVTARPSFNTRTHRSISALSSTLGRALPSLSTYADIP
jgi:hypothetical protein